MLPVVTSGSRRRKIAISILGAVLMAAPVSAVAGDPPAPPESFTFTAGGDMIGPYHPLVVDDPAFRPVAALFRGADLGFSNQEGSIFDLETFAGYPAAENGGGYPQQPAAAARAIRAMGIALVSKANNHATDWGADGLAATLQSLNAAGIVEAGAGLSLDQARAPVYVTTRKGVTALVDVASTFPPMAVAGPAVHRRGVTSKARPGLSALHVRLVHLITANELAALRATVGVTAETGEVRIGDEVFRSARSRGEVWEMEPADEAAVLASIREARKHAAFVVFSIHAHETAGKEDSLAPADYEPMVLHKANEAPSPDDPRPADFEPVLFHAAIDAGADVVVRTGPHATGGVEIYKGRPIFYSLGSLFFDFGGRRSYTTPAGPTMTFPDAWFETVVPVTTFRGGRLSEIRLHPMTIEAAVAERSGVPTPADSIHARRILERLRDQSAAFGTTVQIGGDVGIIRLP